MSKTHRGSCFCGAVTIEARGAPVEMGYCRCSSCRAYSGAPLMAFTLWKAEDVSVIQGAEFPGEFAKTPLSHRQFCKRCGGHVMSAHPALGLSDVHAAILPTVKFVPTVQLNCSEAVLPMKDGLYAITLDMSGTSTDVAFAPGLNPSVVPELKVDDLPVRTPSVDMATIGAGGGSIAGGQLVMTYAPEGVAGKPALLMGHMDTVWAAGTLGVRPVRLTVEGEMNRPPFERSPAVVRLSEATSALAAELGLPMAETSRGGVSDGNFAAALGLPVLDGLDCNGAGAHAEHEHILISTIAPAPPCCRAC